MPGPRLTAQNGSVIVLVLGMIVFVAALMAAFIAQVATDLVVASRTSSESQLRREAYSALETALAVLAERQAVDGALYSPVQGWSDPLKYAGRDVPAGLTVDFSFADETGRLSLPLASADALQRILDQAGVPAGRINQAAEILQTWLRPETGTGQAAGADPHTFRELVALPGLRDLFVDAQGQPTEIQTRLESSVSLYRLRSTNLNSANPAALLALGWTPERIAALTQARDAAGRMGYVRKLEEVAFLPEAAGVEAALDTKIEVLRIRVTVRQGSASRVLEAVVTPKPPAVNPAATTAGSAELSYPFQVLEFREDPPASAVAT